MKNNCNIYHGVGRCMVVDDNADAGWSNKFTVINSDPSKELSRITDFTSGGILPEDNSFRTPDCDPGADDTDNHVRILL